MTAFPARVALAVLVLVSTAAADTREEIRGYIDRGLRDRLWERGRQPAPAWQHEPDAIALWMEETTGHATFDAVGQRSFAFLAKDAFQDRLADLKPAIEGLLKEKDVAKAAFGASMAVHLGFADAFAPALVALLAREDAASEEVASAVFKDAASVALLLAEADQPGKRGVAAIGLLAATRTPEARSYLRKVVLDPKADPKRRKPALGGLAPIGGPEDRKAFDAALGDGDASVVAAALSTLYFAEETSAPDLLHRARPLVDKSLVRIVDQMLCWSGDEEGLKRSIEGARNGENPFHREGFYEAIARSPLPAALDALIADLAAEKDEEVRWLILAELGHKTDPRALDAVAARLKVPEDLGMASYSLALACLRDGADLASLLDRAAAEESVAREALLRMSEVWKEKTTARPDLLRLLEGCVALAERSGDRGGVRRGAVAALRMLSGQEIGDSKDDVARWRAWLKEQKGS